MDKLTDFTDTSDVSDAAIEWVRRNVPAIMQEVDVYTVEQVREDALKDWSIGDRTIILAARLIQQHRPDLLVDPVDAIVREELEGLGWRPGDLSYENRVTLGRRLYLMGVEAGKKS